MSVTILPIENLDKRHPGLTKSIAGCFFEAATICLDRHHISPQIFSILNGSKQIYATAKWNPSSAQTKAAWANEIDATEWGAYGFAIAAVELSEDLYAITVLKQRPELTTTLLQKDIHTMISKMLSGLRYQAQLVKTHLFLILNSTRRSNRLPVAKVTSQQLQLLWASG